MPHPKDETYIVDICDYLLELKGSRRHRFDFLRSDPGRHGIRLPLPVDVYYADLSLVVEYHEHQHCMEIALFEKGVGTSASFRGEQRRKYDIMRREVLPQNGITLLEFGYFEFEHDARKRLKRTPRDHDVVRQRLWSFFGRLNQHQLFSVRTPESSR